VRAIFVGDVHGCVEELEELVARLELGEGDRFVFLGDLVDRGPDSVGVVRRVRELLKRHPGSVCVAGNHEEKNLRLREKQKPLPDWCAKATDDDWSFLDSLPLVHRDEPSGAIAVHGGFFPAYFQKHGAIGPVTPDWRRAKGKQADRQRRFLRVRTVDAEGNMVALGSETADSRHWSASYDGREGFCFFGHDPQLEPSRPLRAPHALGLDTGCCFGGALTAAVVPAGVAPAEATFVTVPARARYAEPRLARME
jgi:diadenosine tetraphosphatase ApaH/serine/threonine PP2A family protein phosphatase